MISRSPTLAEVLNALRDGILRDARVSLPGRVESFDAATNTADIQPMVRETVENDDGTTSQVSLPILTGVPVMFPSGGGFRITFPIAQGDTVLLVFADRSIDAFMSQGQEGSPADQRRHSLSDAVAIPSLVSENRAWTNIEADVITIGKETGSNSDFVALAAKVKSEIQALRDTVSTALSALSGHTHSITTATGTTTNAIVGSPSTLTVFSATTQGGPSLTGPAAVGDVKCTTVKIRD